MLQAAKKGNNMATNITEEDSLKKQIEFLTNLIENAKKGNVGEQEKSYFKQGPSYLKSQQGMKYSSVKDRKQAFSNPSHGHRSIQQNVRTLGSVQAHTGLTSKQQLHIISKTRKKLPKFSSKFKWENDKEKSSSVQQAAVGDLSSVSSIKRTPVNLTTKLENTVNTSAANPVILNDNVSVFPKNVSMPNKTESTVKPTKVKTEASVGVDTTVPHVEMSSISVVQQTFKLKQELQRTQSKIDVLMKKIESSVAESMSPIKTPLRAAIHHDVAEAPGVLLSKSPFKLERVSPKKMAVSSSDSPDVQPSMLASTQSEKRASSITRPQFSTQRLNSSPTTSVKMQLGGSHSSKKGFFAKSMYSISRVKSTSEKSNVPKGTPRRTASRTLVKKTRFSLQRVKSEPETGKPLLKQLRHPSVGNSSMSPYSHTQIVAKTIKSKYKISKVHVASSLKFSSPGKWYSEDNYRDSYYTNRTRGGNSSHIARGANSNYFSRSGNSWYSGNMWPQKQQTRNGKHAVRNRCLYQSRNPWSKKFPKFRWDRSEMGKSFDSHSYIGIKSKRSNYFMQRTKFDRKQALTWTRARAEYTIRKRIDSLKRNIQFDPKLKIDRRKKDSSGVNGINFVMINGMVYKSNTGQKQTAKSKTSHKPTTPAVVNKDTAVSKIKNVDSRNMKTITVRGIKFKMDANGKSLKKVHTDDKKGKAASSLKSQQISRVDIGGVTFIQTRPGTLERLGSAKTRHIATRAVNRSVAAATQKYRKDSTRKLSKKKYCMFYNRFGKCNRQEKCPFVHDPDRVAVCTRFLRGTCKVDNCPFSHKISKEKMPVCSYFLRGQCHRDDCPYLHVNVNRDAEICSDFVDGYCPLGDKCKKKHTLVCPDFTQTGSCPLGRKCKMMHRRNRKRKTTSVSDSTVVVSKLPKESIPVSDTTDPKPGPSGVNSTPVNSPQDQDDPDQPFKNRVLPAYISLFAGSNKKLAEKSDILGSNAGKGEVLKIRPQL